MTGIDILRAAAKTGEGRPPCADTLGWQAEAIEPGRVRVRYEASARFCNPQGVIQGGFLAAMLDDAMGPAGFTLLDDGQFAPTLELKVSFLRPARPGPLVAEGRVVHRARSVLFLEGRLETEDGALVATATATARVVSNRMEVPDE